MPEQLAWRFCDKCFGMFFNGDPNPARKGRCPAGGGHHAQGFVFRLPFGVPESAGQSRWSFCDKCFGMFFDGDNANKGRCPAGGAHHAQGLIFVLPHDIPETMGQPGWAFCEKCFGMFFDGNEANKGRCPAGGGHLFQGFLFVLPHIDFPQPSITLHAVQENGAGKFIEIAGIRFVPSQTVKIDFNISTGDTHRFGEEKEASDAAGRFTHRIQVSGNITAANVGVIDLGSGEVVAGHL